MTHDEALNYYVNLPHEIVLIPDEGGTTFTAVIPDLKGCIAFGGTVQEAREKLAEAKRLWTGTSRTWIETALDEGWPVPEPS